MPIFESVNVAIYATTLYSNLVASLSKKRRGECRPKNSWRCHMQAPGHHCWKIWVLETNVLSYLGFSSLGIIDGLHVVCEYRSHVDTHFGDIVTTETLNAYLEGK